MGGVGRAGVGSGAGMVKASEFADTDAKIASGDTSASRLNISKSLSSGVVEATGLERLGSLVELPDG